MDLRFAWSLLGLALMPTLSVAAGKCERLVVTGSPDAPPYLWQDPQNPKRLIGASADLLQQVAGELGLKVELLYAGKRAQALEEVRSGRMDMLADAPLTVSELETLDYIHPALLENDYLVWTRKDSTLVYNEAQDLHGHPGALSEKARMTPAFSTFAEAAIDPHAHVQSDPGLSETAVGRSRVCTGRTLLRHGDRAEPGYGR
jgi:polar amino acid transport system substrate-binding protein